MLPPKKLVIRKKLMEGLLLGWSNKKIRFGGNEIYVYVNGFYYACILEPNI